MGRTRALGLLATATVVAALTGCDFPGGGSSSDDSDGGTRTVEVLDSEHVNSVSGWATRQGFAEDSTAVAGAKVFAQVGCLSCHTYLGTGSSNLGARDLSAVGRQSNRSMTDYADYLADPSRFGNNVMPRFADLGRPHLLELGAFLEASEGRR
jgi:mono/diheme cytochrome c family protein